MNKGLIIGILGAAGVGLVAATAKASGALSSLPKIPVPSDSSLLSKYGLDEPGDSASKDLIQNASLPSMRIQYAEYTPSCSKYLAGQTPQINSGAGTGLGIASGFLSSVPVIGGVLSDVTGFIASVFDHHAQAVAKEQSTLCAATYAYNKTFDEFDSQIASGQIPVAQAQTALETLYQKLAQMVAPVAQGCPPSTATGTAEHGGNAACYMLRIAQAISEKRLAQLGVVGTVN